jgi:tuftelin-interacting protein 11
MAAGGGKRPNYSKPVGFVGGGVVQHGPQDDKDAEAADEEEGAARGGLGSGAAAGGLGFRPAAAAAPPAPSVRPAAHDEEEEEEELIPTAFGRRIKQAADQRRQQGEAAARSERQQQQQQQQQRGGLGRPGLGGAGAPAPSTGTFEAHTKGIGAKLLSKMGWQAGKGLGKEGTGIAKPLEATLRPKGMGMGFGDRREPKMAPPAPKPAAAADAPAAKGGSAADVRREAALWRSKHEGARVKRTFRTADEVLAEAEEKGASAPAQTIIDMRGPQARVVTNLEHLNVQDEAEGGGGGGGGGPVPMPELQHNVRLLVDLAEADIQRVDARLRHHRDTQTILRREAQRLEAEAAAAEAAAGRLAGVLAAVAAARQGAASSPESARAAFAELRAQLAEDYVMYGLPAVALAAALPALAAALAGWAPLAAPAAPAAAFAAWRPLLQGGASRHADPSSPLSPGGAADPYTRLVADLLLPRLRTALANEWDPREPEPLEALLECWQPLLPAEVVEHVMTHLVLPRLRAAAGEWDPLRDPLPPHIWLHPWLVSEPSRPCCVLHEAGCMKRAEAR